MIFPWLQSRWSTLWTAHRQHRLPHALLLSGPGGIGKEALAVDFAQSLLCQRPDADGIACGNCPSCRLFVAGTHPDFLALRPEESGKSIKIEQVRELSANLTMTSHAGGHKIAIISPADALNLNAANSLLKTLEEPTDNTHMLLVTAAPGRLPVTVRSRCQTVKCQAPTEAEATAWLGKELSGHEDTALLLKAANGAPLAARDLAQQDGLSHWLAFEDELTALTHGTVEPVTLAAQWTQQDGLQRMRWTQGELADAVRRAQAPGLPRGRNESSWMKDLDPIDSRRVFELMDQVTFAVSQWSSGLNTQLLLQDLLLAWVDVFSSTEARRTGGYLVRGT